MFSGTLFVKQKCNTQCKDKIGQTSLHYASEIGLLDVQYQLKKVLILQTWIHVQLTTVSLLQYYKNKKH